MHMRIWLASAAAVTLAVAAASAAAPLLHGQSSLEATESRDVTTSSVERARVQAERAAEQAERAARDARVQAERAVEQAERDTRDAMRDIDVDALVDTALQDLPGLMGGRPRLGVSTRDVTAEEAKAAGLPGVTGAYVEDVSEDTAAHKSGLRAGDIIVSVDGETIRSARHLSRMVSETPDGGALQIEYARGTQKNTVTVTPEARQMTRRMGPGPALRGPGAQQYFFRQGPEGTRPRVWTGRGRLGVGVQGLTEQLAGYFGVTEGVLVTQVEENSAAGKAGVKAGDVITAVNGKPVKDTGDIFEHLSGVEDGKVVPVEISRDKTRQTLSVTLAAPDSFNNRTVARRPRFTA